MTSANDLLAEKMTQIKEQISAEDRKAAQEALRLSGATLTKYIGGDISNPDLGLKLYEFFHGRIQERIARIKEIA